MPVQRRSVDLDGFPDLVVIHLGLRVRAWRGLATLFGLGPGIRAIEREPPDGLLAHESMLFGLTHLGFRQYWRDLASLEAFTRAAPHRGWWRDFLSDARGTGFWHEVYLRRGGMEGIYLDLPAPVGFGRFAPPRDPQGPFATARGRAGHAPAG